MKLPVCSLVGSLVATEVTLANSLKVWALIGNVDVDNARLSEHFLTLTVLYDGKWFTLARYHDLDYVEHGPLALAAFLGLQVDDVFPITYNIRSLVKGEHAALTGSILKDQRERLSRSEIIALAVP